MNERPDGFSECTSSNVALLIESARDVMESIKRLSTRVEAGVHESASLDEIISLLNEKKEMVGVLRDLAREIAVALGAAETGRASITLSDAAARGFFDLVAEFKQLIAEESVLENLVWKRGLTISAGEARRRK